ncbi:MAG: formyltetrahydrofolate deformylase [Kiritimatiellaeota bacterium]|nr:formyltetrahydrofolate deformylase [Kiritimatiellota bacterium]
MREIIFLVQRADAKGLLADIAGFFYDRGFNILDCRQHTDSYAGRYFMRIALDMNDLSTSRNALENDFTGFADERDLEWTVRYSDHIRKVALLVSKTSHCLYDILLKRQEEELHCETPVIISNHPDLEFVAEQFEIPFHCLPVNSESKPEQEAAVLELLLRHHIELVVLARYMRILSPNFLRRFGNPIINIHHAFLPAFQGANPYKRAYERGVKLIGATAHYVTDELDEGPIIEQDVERVSHRHSPEDLKRIGREIERRVLSKALQAHLEHRVIVDSNKTVVFD